MSNIAHVVFEHHRKTVATKEADQAFVNWAMLAVFKSDNAIQFEIESEQAQNARLASDLRVLAESIVNYCPDVGKCSYNDVKELAEFIYWSYVKINRTQQEG
ncbi:hypothetical protein [Vibrio gallaecicus]|uniref:Uncharacterized protein n=1 Tax=Vibrio gallaecicus TaxID=552386 RepID=A0ABV4NGN2_9VIBR